ncbi:hypothetical protein AGOR_G00031710 [Albula goreensis]|uniref:protein kinase C n=1 Tax=Albula goreensis TaxID=1534307 RepID=A0A8T3E7A0_9TELE|nr:hypothetical protein AGOR_G00031710 [Albula goreensis]
MEKVTQCLSCEQEKVVFPPGVPSSPGSMAGSWGAPICVAGLSPGPGGPSSAGVSFTIQIGLTRESALLPQSSDLPYVKQLACSIVDQKFSECGLYGMYDKILLFKHDPDSSNILQLVQSTADIRQDDLIEVVLSAAAAFEEAHVRPHALNVYSYRAPAFCDHCGEMLFGLVRQGLKCAGCGLNYHKRCAFSIPNNCSGARKRRLSCTSLTSEPSFCLSTTQHLCATPTDGLSLAQRGSTTCSLLSGHPTHLDNGLLTRVKVPHTFTVHTYTRPTVCHHCKRLLRGLFRQGLQCKDCKFNCHKRCAYKEPNDCTGETSMNEEAGSCGVEAELMEDGSEIGEGDKSSLMDEPDDTCSIPGSFTPTECNQGESGDQSCTGYIPLMRVVQSVRQTARRSSTNIKEGWMVHYSNKDTMRKRHYWRLDSKSIVLFQNDTSNRYYKEIPLSEVLEVCPATEFSLLPPGTSPHCFQIITASICYFVGKTPPHPHRVHVQSPSFPSSTDPVSLSASASYVAGISGVGRDIAAAWESAIRQALMPVIFQDGLTTQGHASHRQASVSISVSKSQIQENVDIGAVYQIFADEVLGSGQFGVVYGGKHRKSGET